MSHSILDKFKELEEKVSSINTKAILVAVAKGQPLEKISEIQFVPSLQLANNYAQEGETLQEELKSTSGIIWHFIGHIQSRKTKYLVHYDWVQSFDRLEVLVKLNELLKPLNKKVNGLIEVNIGDEAQKSGVSPEALPHFLKALPSLSNIEIRGLMGMPPPLPELEDRRTHFRNLKALFDKHRVAYQWDTLSMGTSEDFSIALEEGSTMVRLGSCLFGTRPKKEG